MISYLYWMDWWINNQTTCYGTGIFLGGGGTFCLSLFLSTTEFQASLLALLICSNKNFFYDSSVYHEVDSTKPSLLIS